MTASLLASLIENDYRRPKKRKKRPVVVPVLKQESAPVVDETEPTASLAERARHTMRRRKLEEQKSLEIKEKARIERHVKTLVASATSRAEQRLRNYNSRLRIEYGITAEHLDTMLASQHYRCAICGRKAHLHVDHCHATGRVRGCLCSRCNTVLGHMQDNISMLEAAIRYLQG